LPQTSKLTSQSIPVIAFGTILGHGICTFGAVMGGRYLSTKISVKWSRSHFLPLASLAKSVFVGDGE
jgi:putative Ca2+/H+ antiporter (TMEM165/GDT1 family)